MAILFEYSDMRLLSNRNAGNLSLRIANPVLIWLDALAKTSRKITHYQVLLFEFCQNVMFDRLFHFFFLKSKTWSSIDLSFSISNCREESTIWCLLISMKLLWVIDFQSHIFWQSPFEVTSRTQIYKMGGRNAGINYQ